MNILCLARATVNHKNSGGLETHLETLCNGFLVRKHQVTIITTEHPGNIIHEKKESLNIYYLKNTTSEKFTKTWWQESAKKALVLHRQNPFDIIYSQEFSGWGCAKNRKYFKYIPIVTILHGTFFQEFKNNLKSISSFKSLICTSKYLLKRTLRFFFVDIPFLHRVDIIIAVNNFIKDIRLGHLILIKPIFIIQNGVDLTKFMPSEEGKKIRYKYGINDSESILLLSGRVCKGKGMQIALQALQNVLRIKSNVRIMLVGSGPFQNQLKSLAGDLNITEKVIFCGFVEYEKLPAYYNCADLFLMPTLVIETNSMCILEAMACGKPVIASAIGGNISQIRNLHNGILVRPGDVSELTKNIIQVLNDTNLKERLASYARETTVNKYDSEKMINSTLKLFENLTEIKNIKCH
ncbi:MAG: glycosyltransferase family 4 protein [Candidatus Omnitrophica bacterium]|nr:glycosyltransferase family 4 protein [Candidatus Omnitrophota bacterium]